MANANSDDDSPRTLTTGMMSLDNQLDGEGLYAGTVTALLAPPNSSGEHLLYNLIGERDTVYFTAARNPETIENTIREIFPDIENLDVSFLDDSPETAIKALENADIPEYGTLVIDPVNFLERCDPAEYREFLQVFTRKCKESGCLGILHCNIEASEPPLRWLTLQMSDAIFAIDHSETHEDVEDHLLIPKLYGSQTLSERTFKLPHSLTIDVGTKESIRA